MSAGRIRFALAGPPVAKGRPRFGRDAAGKAVAFTPLKTRDYQALLRAAARRAMAGAPPLEAPLRVTVRAFLAIPSSFSRKRAAAAERGELLPAVRPDLDNLVKLALDACNKVVFRDDALVVELVARKLYATEPRLDIEVEPVGEEGGS